MRRQDFVPGSKTESGGCAALCFAWPGAPLTDAGLVKWKGLIGWGRRPRFRVTERAAPAAPVTTPAEPLHPARPEGRIQHEGNHRFRLGLHPVGLRLSDAAILHGLVSELLESGQDRIGQLLLAHALILGDLRQRLACRPLGIQLLGRDAQCLGNGIVDRVRLTDHAAAAAATAATARAIPSHHGGFRPRRRRLRQGRANHEQSDHAQHNHCAHYTSQDNECLFHSSYLRVFDVRRVLPALQPQSITELMKAW